MGIADDISPRRKHTSASPELYSSGDYVDAPKIEPHHKEAVPIKPELKEDVETEQKPNSAKDDFFPETESNQASAKKLSTAKKSTKPKKRSFLSYIFNRKLLFLIVFFALAYYIFANFDQVKEMISGEPESDEPAVVIVAQDYAATADKATETATEAATETVPAETATTPETTTTPTSTTATTTTATIDKTALTISLLNGNGINNSAAEVKKTLVADGYTVGHLGNAKNFNYATSFVYHKTGKEAEAAALKTLLSTKSITVENDDIICKTYDIVIVVGKK